VKLRVATCAKLPEPDTDEHVLGDALTTAGIAAQLVAWDDPSADWDAPIPTVIRSTWNYVRDVDAFLHWLDRASASAPLWNPPDIVRGNVRKRYLLELAARGVTIVPTQLFEHGAALPTAPFEHRVVIKPEVGAGSFHARAFELGDPAAHAHLAMLTARGAALVQPYVPSVDDYGERSIIFIAGELTHAIRKAPRFAGGIEQTTGPFAIDDAERALAEAALAPYRERLLYARVDMARDAAGAPMLMELELVEPSLFFTRSAYALDRFVSALAARLRS
jgi:glutathione synthase/RimK-type ligase-like ATP-grasp enzyme